ncbi:MAG TPA: DUF2946 family protein [Gallionella sp.]
MSLVTRKFVAVLMLLWLPLLSSSALATSVSMQLQQGGCHQASTPVMSHGDMAEGMTGHHHDEMMASADEQGASCNACGVCHLACTGYLAVPAAQVVAMQLSAGEIAPCLVSFISFTSAPLNPPPLVRV